VQHTGFWQGNHSKYIPSQEHDAYYKHVGRRKANILFCLNNLSMMGGLQETVRSIAREAYKNGAYIIRALCLRKADDAPDTFVEGGGFPVLYIEPSRLAEQLRDIVQEHCIDIIHIHYQPETMKALASAACADIRKRCSIIETVHNHYTWEKETGIGNRSCVDKFVCCSQEVLEYFSEKHGIPPRKCCVLKNSINDVQYRRQVENVDFPWRGTPFVVSCITRFDAHKGVGKTIRIFDKAWQQNNDMVLALGGDGAEKKNLVHLASTLPCRDNVFFLGQLDRRRVRALLQKTSVFLYQSTLDGLPLCVLEAMAAGTVVISAPAGGVREIITHGADGFIAVGDEALRLLLDVKNAWGKAHIERMRAAAIHKIREKHSADFMAHTMCEIYNDEIKKKAVS